MDHAGFDSPSDDSAVASETGFGPPSWDLAHCGSDFIKIDLALPGSFDNLDL